MSSGLNAGGGAVAGVHGGGGRNWADDGPNTRKQLLVASKKPAIGSELAGRLTIVYHQYDKSWVVVNEAWLADKQTLTGWLWRDWYCFYDLLQDLSWRLSKIYNKEFF